MHHAWADVAAHLDPAHLTIIAAGKAAAPMARAVVELAGPAIQRGLVAGPAAPAHPLPAAWHVVPAAHPLPDERSVEAGEIALRLADDARRGSLLVLLSGGASSMLCVPADGMALEDKRVAAQRLMDGGAAIHELNCVRKHLSRIKGGQLAARAGRVQTMTISDVHWPVEDDPSVIGGGPTAADPSTFADALAIAKRVPGMPTGVMARLHLGAEGRVDETIKPGDPRLEGAGYLVIGGRRTALEGAASEARRLGYAVLIEEAPTHTAARDEGRAFVERAGRTAAGAGGPLCVLAAGETTVRVTGRGRGGRNQEFALAAAQALAGWPRLALAASAGTDGRDGPTDAAGAAADSATIANAARRGLDADAALGQNDAYPFFEALGDLIICGPTGTNVGDLHLLLVP